MTDLPASARVVKHSWDRGGSIAVDHRGKVRINDM